MIENWSVQKLKSTWRIIYWSAILLIAVTFSPLVLIQGKLDPHWLKMPFHLWVSILNTILLVALTGVGGYVFYTLKSKTENNQNL